VDQQTAATVVVVAAGAAPFEVALLPGLAIGVAAIASPKHVARLGGAIARIFRSTVRATYKLAKTPKQAFAGGGSTASSPRHDPRMQAISTLEPRKNCARPLESLVRQALAIQVGFAVRAAGSSLRIAA
jgi:hypothetical protein